MKPETKKVSYETLKDLIFYGGILLVIYLFLTGTIPDSCGPCPLSQINDGYVLRYPSSSREVEWLMNTCLVENNTYSDDYRCHDFAWDTARFCELYGIRCDVGIVIRDDRLTQHAVVGFRVPPTQQEKNWTYLYYEPQSGKEIIDIENYTISWAIGK